MVVARSCRRRRSLAASRSSPTSLTGRPEGTGGPFCRRPLTVRDGTDFPDPLSPTRHSVSPLLTCSETPSMIRSLRGSLPRPTTRLSISRTMSVMSLPIPTVSFRDGARAPDPEGRSSGFASLTRPGMTAARSLAALAALHAGIERIARGVADQVDAEDGDRQQQPRPEDQRRFYLKIGATLRHHVTPGRGFRIDAGAEERQDRLGENGGSAD